MTTRRNWPPFSKPWRLIPNWRTGRFEPLRFVWAARSIGRTRLPSWLSLHLVAELAAALTDQTAGPPPGGISWRLPSLVKKLFDCAEDLRDFQARLEREKLAAMKELAYGASHEINNPLANIAARAQTLLQDEHDPERRQKLIAIHRQAMRAHEMIADLMLIARPPKLNPTTIDLNRLVSRVVGEFTALPQEDSVRVDFSAEERPIDIVADETQLGVAIYAVVQNAIEAVNHNGSVRVTLERVMRADKPCAEIVVRDDGPGISDEVRQHMFDPFFSGREAGRGLGFGLSKCWRIVTDHGGQVVVRPPIGEGAEISILLPLSLPARVDCQTSASAASR